MKSKNGSFFTWLLISAWILLSGCAPTTWKGAVTGDKNMLESSINAGQDIDAQNPFGNTPLILAVDKGNTEIARLLIDKGANLDTKNKSGVTALIVAAHKGSTGIARMLIEKGANLDTQDQGITNVKSVYGCTALIFAAINGNVDIARSLIEKGAKLDTQNQEGDTALTIAAINGNVDIARLLVEKGANLDIQNQGGANPNLVFGNTALILAVSKGDINIARLLIEKGAKLDTQNQEGNTALILATIKNNTNIAQLLIENGANLDIRSKNDKTALDFAIAFNHYTIAEMLRTKTGSRPPSSARPPSTFLPGAYTTFTGTGWVTEGGYVVTNYHVIEGQVRLTIRFNSFGPEEYPARVVLSDPNNDLAILKIENPPNNKPKGIPIAVKLPKIGAEVFTIGYPKSDVMGVNPKVTNGIISSLTGIQDDPRIIQTTVAIQSGNSGGPLLTMNGEVVGVTTSSLRSKVTQQRIDVPQSVN